MRRARDTVLWIWQPVLKCRENSTVKILGGRGRAGGWELFSVAQVVDNAHNVSIETIKYSGMRVQVGVV